MSCVNVCIVDIHLKYLHLKDLVIHPRFTRNHTSRSRPQPSRQTSWEETGRTREERLVPKELGLMDPYKPTI